MFIIILILGALVAAVIYYSRNGQKSNLPSGENAAFGKPDFSYKGWGSEIAIYREERKIYLVGKTSSSHPVTSAKVSKLITFKDILSMQFPETYALQIEIRDLETPNVYVMFGGEGPRNEWASRIKQVCWGK